MTRPPPPKVGDSDMFPSRRGGLEGEKKSNAAYPPPPTTTDTSTTASSSALGGYRTASEALEGARREARQLAAESGALGGSGGGYGDFSDSRPLLAKKSGTPPTKSTSAILSAFGGGSKSREDAADAAFLRSCLGREQAETEQGETAEVCKGRGNDAFERGEFLEAIRWYSQGIDMLENGNRMASKLRSGGVSSAALTAHHLDDGSGGGVGNKILLSALYSNRSASYLQASKQLGSTEKAYDHSLFDADQTVSLRPDWFKGYARQGDAYFKMARYHQAVESYAMALSLEPGNQKIAESLKEARERAKAGSREEWQARRARRAQQRNNSNNNSESSSLQNTANSLHLQSSLGSNSPYLSSATALSGPSVNARGLWESFKSEMELTNNAPTGDNYRQQQLERFRQHKEGGGSSAGESLNSTLRSSYPEDACKGGGGGLYGSGMDHRSSASLPRSGGGDGGGTPVLPPISKKNSLSSGSIPVEYSTAAATAYQQKLLENYRRKRGAG